MNGSRQDMIPTLSDIHALPESSTRTKHTVGSKLPAIQTMPMVPSLDLSVRLSTKASTPYLMRAAACAT
ncbi:hypothetical protein BKG77_09860 [Mycobacteroides chelonae]|nr:hypothetical protein BKG77_09860 [Mycobacteroides chelonae]